MTGRLIAVVGPSGVGKDSVIAGLVAGGGFGRVRRVVTRATAAGEEIEAVSEAAFAARVAAGDFALWWRAHGLGYGIPAGVGAEVAAGRRMLVNLSRGVLAQAAATFPMTVLHLVARPEVLAARLAGWGRETGAEIAARLAREGAPLPAGLDIVTIANDGSLVETVAAARAALQPVSAKLST